VAKEQVDYDEALPAYAAALRFDPHQPKVRLEMAEVLVKTGRYAEAERALAACKGEVAEGDRLALVAESLRARGETGALRTVLDDGLALSPDHPGLLGQRSQLDVIEGRPDVALGRLDRALAADPYNEPCCYQRGLLLRRLGRDKDAERDLTRSLEMRRDLAELSKLDGEASRRPADPDVRDRLGRLCVRLGKRALAASWFRAALACNPSHQAAQRALHALETGRPVPPD
jgi:tetratricopeptide (TPR) repeat protein